MTRVFVCSALFTTPYAAFFFSAAVSCWTDFKAMYGGSVSSEKGSYLFCEAAGRKEPIFTVYHEAATHARVRRVLLPLTVSEIGDGSAHVKPSTEEIRTLAPRLPRDTSGVSDNLRGGSGAAPSEVGATDSRETPDKKLAEVLDKETSAEEGREVVVQAGDAGKEGETQTNPSAYGGQDANVRLSVELPLSFARGSPEEENEEGSCAQPEDTTPNVQETTLAVVPLEGTQEEADEYDHEAVDFQLYLPQQLRKVIPGTNVDYYDYVIMEERRARGETDELPDLRSGLLPDGPEKVIPQVTLGNGVFVYCYTVETEVLLSRCVDAAKLGVGVYVPMVNMTDFGRHDDHQLGNPSLQEVYLSPSHYAEAVSHFPDSWFEAVDQLKKQTRLAVGGLWFGPPNFKKMDAVLRDHPKVFDGILVDWDSGEGACMNQLLAPPPFNARGQRTYWWTADFFMRYYVGGQDLKICKLRDGQPYTRELFTSHREREIDVPYGWNMTFPCFGGYEGRCYKAFSSQPQQACSGAQRYVFAPYDRASESMMILLNDTCTGLGKPMPPHDIVLAV